MKTVFFVPLGNTAPFSTSSCVHWPLSHGFHTRSLSAPTDTSVNSLKVLLVHKITDKLTTTCITLDNSILQTCEATSQLFFNRSVKSAIISFSIFYRLSSEILTISIFLAYGT